MKTILALLFLVGSQANAETEIQKPCNSAKEFIAAFEFLKSKSNLVGTADQAAQVAVQVAAGCAGSAQRFIKTAEMLEKTELAMRDIVNTSVMMAKSTDAVADSFRRVFTKGYAADAFDLDYNSALKLAKNLSAEFKGDAKKAMKDFDRISEFCLSAKSLDLPKPECAKMAERIALIGQKYDERVADSFVEAYEYMTDSKTVGLTTGDALKLAEKVLNKSSDGAKTFKLTYEYATAKSGMALPRDQAVKLASEL